MKYRIRTGKTVRLFLFCALSALQPSCSLDYGQASQVQIASPEFIFHDAEFTRVERNKAKVTVRAARLEQYRGTDSMYAKDVSFTVYDDKQQPSVTGSCSILAAEPENKKYYFFSHVHIASTEHRARISAENLCWNEETLTLESGKQDKVRVLVETDEGTLIETEGTGFISRQKDLTFAFTQDVSGSVTEKKPADKTEVPQSREEAHDE